MNSLAIESNNEENENENENENKNQESFVRKYTIPVSRKDSVIAYIEKFNKQNEKKGLATYQYSFGKITEEIREKIVCNDCGEKRTKNVKVMAIEVTIIGPITSVYNGWQFVAKIQNVISDKSDSSNLDEEKDHQQKPSHSQDSNGCGKSINLIMSQSSDIELPKEYFHTTNKCDHCHSNRNRIYGFVVFNVNSKEYKQIGSTCVKDFLGVKNADKIIQQINSDFMFYVFLMGVSDFETLGNSDSLSGNYLNLKLFLTKCACAIRKYGWVSSGTAREKGIQSTAETAIDLIKNDVNNAFILEEDSELAEFAINWFESLPDEVSDSNSFFHNLKIIAQTGFVSGKFINFAAAMITAYQREQQKNIQKSISNHFGEIKKRYPLELTFIRRTYYDSMYGTKYIFNFVDKYGNIFVWKTTTAAPIDCMTINKIYIVTGTVSRHTIYKGTKQTEIQRCNISEL